MTITKFAEAGARRNVQVLRRVLPGIFVLALATPMFSDSRRDVEGPRIAVYLPDYRAKSLESLELHGTTDLILFSAKPREDGSVDFSRISTSMLSLARKAQSENGVAATVCVGGWGRGKTFAKAVSAADSRSRFASDLAGFCSKHELDGVDIDWEFPKGEREHADLALFLEELWRKLHGDSRILTIAPGYTRPLPQPCWQWIDRVHLMSYQPWSEQDYEPWLEESVQRFLDAGLPPEKLVVGLGFFAKEKAGDRRAVSWRKPKEGPQLPPSDHGFWPVGPEACDLRIDLVKRLALGGVMVWEYGHDAVGEKDSLLRYLSNGLGRSAPAQE
jgi:hypothetical protein